MMFNLFRRRPPPDPEQVARIRGWVVAHMALGDDDHVMVAELRCYEPGCPDFETVVTVLKHDKRRFVLKFPTPVLDVTKADVTGLKLPSLG
jgi:hypothetical protein